MSIKDYALELGVSSEVILKKLKEFSADFKYNKLPENKKEWN